MAIEDDITEHLKNKYFIGLLLVLGVATFIRFKYAFGTGMWVDEGRYARIGFEVSNHLLSYSTTTEWLGQVTGHPPVFSYLIALSTYVFGKTDFAVRAVSPIMGVFGVPLAYFLGREMKNRSTGLAVAALLALNPIYWFMSEKILIGVTLTVFYTASILALYWGFSDRKDYYYGLWLLGPLTVLTILTKQPGYTLGPVILLYFLYVKRNEFLELTEDIEFKKTALHDTLTDRNYYIGAGLGVLTLAPWALRNLEVCGVPLCGLSRALGFATQNVTSPLSDVGGTFYFLFSLPFIVTLPVALLLGFRIVQYLLDQADRDADMLVKLGAAFIAVNLVAYFIWPRFVPMALLTSIALFATSREEKLLWLWIGIGIGFMSIPEIKVPRYILFTLPAMLIVSVTGLKSITDWLAKQFDRSSITGFNLLVLALLPILLVSYVQGIGMVTRGGFTAIEPAGEWIASNTPESTNVASTSPTQTRYFVYPRDSYRVPDNETEFIEMIQEKNISHVMVDVYESTQAEWIQTGVPPYRLPYSLRQALQNGQVSPQQAASMFRNPPSYLEPVNSFGRTPIPLIQNQEQPAAIVYRVNSTALQ